MPKEPFMLVSLNEDKAKKLAQVMSNPTCIKILEHLAGKDATESAIAKDLGLPLSTVHYNIQQLVAAKLVIVDEFHYSEKGREVNHYKLANKYIIIAPQDDDPALLERLKKFIPITIITLGFAAVLKTTQLLTGTLSMGKSAASDLSMNSFAADAIPSPAPMLKTAAAPALEQGVDSMMEGVADAAISSGAGGVAPEGARTMAMVAPEPAGDAMLNATAKMASDATNEGVNEAMDYVVDEVTQDSANAAFVPSIDPSAQQSVPWWQSHAIDYFIAGALFVLCIFVIAETIAYLRAKRGKN